MALFRKAEPAPAPAQLPVLYEPPIQPSAAPKATDLEREIRREIWQHMSPQLAHAAGLSLPELIDFVSGASRLTTPQIEALGRKMGLLTKPETFVDALRRGLAARMKKQPGFDWLEWPNGARGEDNLRDFIEGADCLTLPELNHLARAFYGKYAEVDPVTGMLKSTAPEPTVFATIKIENWSKGSNVPGINEMAIAHLREQLRQLEAS